MLLDKIDVRPIIADHVDTFRDFGTHKRSAFDILLFFGLPVAIATVALWSGIRIQAIAVGGILTASSIFVALLPNLLLMVLTFLQNTRGESADRFLQIRKRFLREIAINISFSLILSLALASTAIGSLIVLPKEQEPIGPALTFLLITGSVAFLLTVLMLIRRMYALVLNEFDRHKLNQAA
jgi:hypothetical protein